MEEKKTKKSKAKEVALDSQEKPKLSYEELEQAAANLNHQCQVMYQKLQEAEKIINNFNDVGMLLSILKASEFFNEAFIQRCSEKIESTVSGMLDSVEDKNQ